MMPTATRSLERWLRDRNLPFLVNCLGLIRIQAALIKVLL